VFKRGQQGVGYYADTPRGATAPAAAAAGAGATAAAAAAGAAAGAAAAAATSATAALHGGGWVGMRTVAELRRATGVGAPRNTDSLYAPVERRARVFNPLRVPAKLQAALPFKTKPKVVRGGCDARGGGGVRCGACEHASGATSHTHPHDTTATHTHTRRTHSPPTTGGAAQAQDAGGQARRGAGEERGRRGHTAAAAQRHPQRQGGQAAQRGQQACWLLRVLRAWCCPGCRSSWPDAPPCGGVSHMGACLVTLLSHALRLAHAPLLSRAHTQAA
jgi:hypothetical protein